MKCFQEAKKFAIKRLDNRNFILGAVGIRKDGAKVFSRNGANRNRDFRSHAEARLCRKLDQGSVVWVVRVSRNGALASARPCEHCQKILRSTGVKRCFYSVSNSEYGVLEFK